MAASDTMGIRSVFGMSSQTHSERSDANEIVFIDPAVSDVDVLLAGLRPEIEPILLNAVEPAARQMARALVGRRGLGAIHVIAHGAPGEVTFAAGRLSLECLDEPAADLAKIGHALEQTGALLLWSCHTGAGPRGTAWLQRLARATGARVAASSQLVGATSRGGSWELDARPSHAAVRPPLSAEGTAAYAGLMADFTNKGTLNQTGTLSVSGTIFNIGTINLLGGALSAGIGISNTGTITGWGTMTGAVSGGGPITATGGTLTINGSITDSGNVLTLTVGSGASDKLLLDGASAANSLTFSGSTGALELNTSSTLTLGTSLTIGANTVQLDGSSSTLTDTSGVSISTGGKIIGTGVVNGDISGSGTIEGTGGTLTLANNLTSSTLLLEADSAASSVLALGGTVSASTSFTYLNTGGVHSGTLLLLNSTAVTSFGTNGVISGMEVGTDLTPTDILDLRSISSATLHHTSITDSNTVIHLFDSSNVELAHFTLDAAVAAGTFVDWTTDGSGGSDVFLSTTVCFAAGTRVLTALGEQMVEDLRHGDIVMTMRGAEQVAEPIKWVGRRRIDLTVHRWPETIAPVRIRRGAFADNMPHSDLFLSPNHAVFVDGMLICVHQLINGTTILQEKNRTSVEYFHVELNAHAILLTEGLPTESYLDTGNRGFFANSGEPLILHPDLKDETDYPVREVGSCHPFISDGAHIKPIWQRLADRAAVLGHPAPSLETTMDPELRIRAKGRLVRPMYDKDGLLLFALPLGTTNVRLISRATSPTDTQPWLGDSRLLGASVRRIILRSSDKVYEIPVDHPNLSTGWYDVERSGVAMWRWTDGDAVLPLPAIQGQAILELQTTVGGLLYVTGVADNRRAA